MILSVTNFASTLYEETTSDLDSLLEQFDDDVKENKILYEIIIKASMTAKKEDEDDITDEELNNILSSDDDDIEDDDIRMYVDDEDLKHEYFNLKKELKHGQSTK